MRVSPSQTAKSETDARGERSKRYLPSSTCGEWLSKIWRTRTRACWLSTSTSTFITASESMESSGLSSIEEGISTPDCALPFGDVKSKGNENETSSRTSGTRRRATVAVDSRLRAFDSLPRALRASRSFIATPQSADLSPAELDSAELNSAESKKFASKRTRPPVVPKKTWPPRPTTLKTVCDGSSSRRRVHFCERRSKTSAPSSVPTKNRSASPHIAFALPKAA